jgi:hypothetical protein
MSEEPDMIYDLPEIRFLKDLYAAARVPSAVTQMRPMVVT